MRVRFHVIAVAPGDAPGAGAGEGEPQAGSRTALARFAKYATAPCDRFRPADALHRAVIGAVLVRAERRARRCVRRRRKRSVRWPYSFAPGGAPGAGEGGEESAASAARLALSASRSPQSADPRLLPTAAWELIPGARRNTSPHCVPFKRTGTLRQQARSRLA